MIENHSVRRRARSLMTFLNSFSGESDNKNQNPEDLDFNKANFNIARIPDIPQQMKEEIADNPNSLWSLMESLKCILSSIIMKHSECENDDITPEHIQNEGFKSGEGSQGQSSNFEDDAQGTSTSESEIDFDALQDAVLDQLDESIPEDYKNQLPENLQQRLNNLLKGIGDDNLNYIKSNGKLLDKLQKQAVNQLCQERASYSDEVLGKEIGNKAVRQKQKEDILRDFGYKGEPGHADTTSGNTGFQIMVQFAEKLSMSKDLQHLAEILGRHEDSNEEDDKAKDVSVSDRFELSRAYRGNVVGFEYSNDISRVVPSEISLLNNPVTENLFYHKFAEKQLLSYSYEQKSKSEGKEKRQAKGPIVLCIDTSGSMMGKPEDVAKSIVFAVSRIAIKEKRKCYIISFSVGTEALDFDDFGNGQALNKLVSFLKNSFYGGTDIEPCLKTAMEQLKREEYKKADIMVISDFEMYDLGKKTIENMNLEKSLGTRFHSMLVGSYGPNQSVINQFDKRWKYKGDDKFSGIRFDLDNQKLEKERSVV